MTMNQMPAQEEARFAPPVPAVAAGLVLVSACVAVVHWPVLQAHAITADDHQYLLDNPLVQNPSWDSVGRFFTEVLEPGTVGGYYQPLAMTSLMIDVAFGGGPENLRPFHATSLALHVVNCCLIALLIHRLFGSLTAATLTALVFGLHPLTVEPIAWISDRKTLLAAFLVFLCLLAYLRFVRTRRTTELAASAVLFSAALLAKPTSTPLPLVLILLDVWPLRRLSWRTLREKLPFVAIAAVSAIITIISQSRTASISRPPDQTAAHVPLIVCHNLVFYLSKMLWPVNLSRIYPFPRPLSLENPAILAGVILTPLLLVALVLSLRYTRSLLTGWLMFFVAIFPTLGVIGFTNVIAGDKYVYLPAFGLLLPLASGLTWLLAGEGGEAASLSTSPRRISASYAGETRRRTFGLRATAATGLVLVAVAAEAAATRSYLDQWRDTPSLLAHMLRHAPEEAGLHFDLGFWRQSAGRIEEAKRHYRDALQLDPHLPNAHINLGLLLADEGRHEEAIAHYREVLRINPRAVDALSNLALALIALGRVQEAVRACEEAISYKANFAPAHNNLGMALGMQNQLDAAVAEFERALELRPAFEQARKNLAAAYWRQGRMPQAIQQYEDLVKRNPSDASNRKLLGRAYQQVGRLEEAGRQYEAARRVDPNDAELPELFESLAQALSRAAGKTSSRTPPGG